MKYRVIIVIILALLVFNIGAAVAETNPSFASDLKKAVNNHFFSVKDLNYLMQEYSQLLIPHSDSERLFNSMLGKQVAEFPLAEFKSDDLYKNSIQKLFDSRNQNHRLLAYLLLASANDTSFNERLLERLKTEKRPENRIWGGMTLLYLKDNHLDEMFDFLVANETFGDPHMIPLFIRLDHDRLRETAIKKINASDPKAKILAATLLGETGYTPETERVLKQAVGDWPVEVKGYAVHSLFRIKAGNLLGLLKPLLEEKELRAVSLLALAGSPTPKDNDYLLTLIPSHVIPTDILDALFLSDNPGSVEAWLELIQKEDYVPNEYSFSVTDNQLLSSDAFQGKVIKVLKSLKTPEFISELLRTLAGRTDSESTKTLVSFLRFPDPEGNVREWAANSLKGNHSEIVVNEIKELIKDEEYRTPNLTNLIIENKIAGLQSTYDEILADNGDDISWRRSCILYLSKYPQEYHRELFRKIIADKEEDLSVVKNACLGLGMLKDRSSVPVIGGLLLKEAKWSEYNAPAYLTALGMIKGDEARKYVAMFKDSKYENVRKLVSDILENWDK